VGTLRGHQRAGLLAAYGQFFMATDNRVETTEKTAVPAEYRERPVGAKLAARVTAMHKAQALSSQPPATEDTRARAAAEATAAALRARQAASASTAARRGGSAPTVDALRTHAARKAEQQREQLRIAGLAAKGRDVGDTHGDRIWPPATDRSRDERER